MKLLVTGGAGFIGSNAIQYFLSLGKYTIVNLDALTYAGNLDNLKSVSNHPDYTFVKGNICNKELVDFLFEQHEFDAVINFAAESHVDRSIDNPLIFLETNILGTNTLLDVSKKYWSKEPSNKYCFEYSEGKKFLQISTDEVYGDLLEGDFFREDTPLAPSSPYSASKTSADMLVMAYARTYGFPANITRCSNNYGPYQFPEKLIPLMILNCIQGKRLPVYGDGLQVRDWLHVKDHCMAIETVLQKGVSGEVYNVGGKTEKTNIKIVKLILEALGKDESLIEYVADRPGHDRRYAIDNTKITAQLQWQPSYTFEDGMKETIAWYLANQEWMYALSSR